MKLFATPLSHFSRKIRILLDLYGVSYEFIDVGNVAEGDMHKFAGNPLMRVPVLVNGNEWIIESDHIAQYLVRKFDAQDKYKVFIQDVKELNLRAVLNGIMAEEVKLIIARRTGVPTEKFVFFEDAIESMKNGLSWLEHNASSFDAYQPKYRDFHLLCILEHLKYYDLIPLDYPKLTKIVSQLSDVPELKKTNPFLLKPKT